MQCEWMVPWEPGELRAIAYRDGKEVARTTQKTAGAPAALKISMQGSEYPIATVAQVDKTGAMNPYGENRVHYHVDGPAEIVSLESGNPVNTEPNFGVNSRTTFFGLGRCFLKQNEGSREATLIAAAILGDKQLHGSDKVSIDVQQMNLNGENIESDLTVRYSLNSSKSDLPYSGPFVVKPDTTVTASVLRGNEVLFEMSERFGPGEGLYWGTDTPTGDQPEAVADSGLQAEDATLHRAKVVSKGNGYRGRGFVDFGHNKGGYVEWYREHDGATERLTAKFRYSGKRDKRKAASMKLTINGKTRAILFPNTKGWGTDWKTLEVPLVLRPGANNIRLTTDESGGMYIDELTIE